MAGKGKTKPLEKVRALFRREGLDAIWEWAADGEGAQEKAHRFRILEIFAQRQRDQEKPASRARAEWAARRVIYASARDRWEERAARKAEVDFDTSLGAPHWGGARDFFDALIYPIAREYDQSPDFDDKEYGHAVGGDHDPRVANAFAEDFPTYSGAAFARAVAKRLGSPSGGVGTYAFIYYTYKGVRFRVQILWAVEDHFDHVHIGARTV